jgi:elongation factor P--beta-lysine ligase
MLHAVADWWDAVELWITQLPFPMQVVLAILLVLPLCWGTAAGVDRLVGLAAAQLRRDRTNGPSSR